jgi:Uma2 family endonuclease
MAIRRALTYEDYAAMPTEGYRCEILDGEDRRLGELFLSPITVILAPTTIVEPDIVFVDRMRAGLVSSRGIEGAPTLAVEVLSPSTTARDRGPKFQLYARLRRPLLLDRGPRRTGRRSLRVG